MGNLAVANAEVQPVQENAQTKQVQSKINYKIVAIRVTGNVKTTEKQILKLLPALEIGKNLSTATLSKQIQTANAYGNIFLKVDLSPEKGGYQATIIVQEAAKQDTFYTAIESTGNDFTGNSRLILGYLNPNLNEDSDLLGINVVLSPEKMDKFYQGGFFYRKLLPRTSDSIHFHASYSDSRLGVVSEQAIGNLGNMTISAAGKGLTTGITYQHNLVNKPTEKQNLFFGINYNQNKNSQELNFFGTKLPDMGVDTDSLKASLSWNHSLHSTKTNFSYMLGVNTNLAGNEKSYHESRFGSDKNFTTFNYGLNYQGKLKGDWILAASMFGQYSSNKLIYPEQMSLGGMYTVRGFKQGIIQGDQAYFARFEVYTPEIAPNHRLLAFYDIGETHNNDANVGEYATQTIAGTGIGWKYTDNKNGWALGMSYGFAVKKPSFAVDDGRFDFSVMKRF